MGKYLIIKSVTDIDLTKIYEFGQDETKKSTTVTVLEEMIKDEWVVSYEFVDNVPGRAYHSYGKFLQWLAKSYFGL